MTIDDSDLVRQLVQQMRFATDHDTPSPALVGRLEQLEVRAPGLSRALAPVAVVAAVTAVTAGGLLLSSQHGPARTSGQSGSTAAVGTTSVPPAPTGTVAPSRAPAAATTAAGVTTAPKHSSTGQFVPNLALPVPANPWAAPSSPAPADGRDDRAIIAHASWWSTTSVVVVAGHPDRTIHQGGFWFGHHSDTIHLGKYGVPYGSGPWEWASGPSEYPIGESHHDFSWDDLTNFPTQPSALAAELGTRYFANTVEETVAVPLSVQARRGVMELDEQLPGAVVTRDTHDSRGRAAIMVARVENDFTRELYFDPISYRLLEDFQTPAPGATPQDQAKGSDRTIYLTWEFDAPKVDLSQVPPLAPGAIYSNPPLPPACKNKVSCGQPVSG